MITQSRCWLWVWMIWVTPLAHAAEDPCKRTAYLSLRYDEDWRFLRSAACQTDWLDPLKLVTFDQSGERYLTLGGEARMRYDRFTNPAFGAEVDDADGFWLQRYLLHADLHRSEQFRFFGQLQSSLINDRKAGPRPSDKNAFDVNQVFADWTPFRTSEKFLTFRLGRQELEFGASRIISGRDGLNDRLSFDGLTIHGNHGPWRYNGGITRPVLNKPGSLDDESHDQGRFWGLSLARSHQLLPGATSVIYFHRRDQDSLRYDQGVADEQRYTLGTRWSGRGSHWDYNFETGLQFGDFGDASIRAWYIATDNGWTWPAVRFKPRLGLRIDAASGDRDPNDSRLNTFNPLFASAAYSGLAGLIGPSNSFDVAPSTALRLNDKTVLTSGVVGFWRQSVHDGIYGTLQNLQRTGQRSRARHVGNQATLQLTWSATNHLTLYSTLSYFVVGRVLKDTPPAENVSYFTAFATYRF